MLHVKYIEKAVAAIWRFNIDQSIQYALIDFDSIMAIFFLLLRVGL